MTARLRTVYFMRPVGCTGPVKIGCSSYLPKRLNDLSVWSPVPLEVFASFPGGIAQEWAIQYKFRDSLSHHEWFHWSPELESLMLDVAAGDFDIASIPTPPKYSKPGHRGRKPNVQAAA